MLPRTAVVGLGNVLMRDDGFGPYVIAVLHARYEIPEALPVMDLGTPGLDLVPYVVGLQALVIVDTVRAAAPPGTLRRYGRDALARPLKPRVGPHDPGLENALFAAAMADAEPLDVTLVGVVPQDVGMGAGLSPAVADAVEPTVQAVVDELRRLGWTLTPRALPARPDLWWERPAGLVPA